MSDGPPAYNLSVVTGPRNFTNGPEDHSGTALVICTLMTVWSVLCFLVRIYMRSSASGPFGADDLLTGLATLFGVAQMAASAVAISHGFGKNLSLISPADVIQAQKALYAAQLLFLVTNALTKCAVSLLLARIVFIKSRVQACYVVLGISAAWGLGSFLAQAIRCTDVPAWSIIGRQCTNNILSWEVITGFNVMIEVLLFAMPIWLVWSLQTESKRKITVVTVFGLRLPVIAAALARIHFISTLNQNQPLLAGVIPFICLNVEMHYGLMAATMPTLKPFVGSFNTGWGTYDTQGVSGYGSNSNSYAMRSLDRGGNTGASRNRSQGASQLDQIAEVDDRLKYTGKTLTQVKAKTNDGRSNSGSSDSSQQMIIRQTTTCEVSYDDETARAGSRSGYTSMDYHARTTSQS